jgi:hypothetical protein
MTYALTEEPIDKARQHVLQAECLVARQRVVVERLRSGGQVELIPRRRGLCSSI